MTFQAERGATRPYFLRWWLWWLLTALALTIAMKLGYLPEKRWWVSGPMMILWILTAFVLPVGFLLRSNKWGGEQNAREKAEGIVPAIRFLAPEFEYGQSRRVSDERVRTSRIFESYGDITEIVGDDHFSGMIGKTAVEYSEVRVTAKDRVRRDDKGNPVTWHLAGMFVVADFNKPFQHATLVMPDPLEKQLGSEVSKLLTGAATAIASIDMSARTAVAPGSEWRLVRLENLEFERLFQVYCTDPVEAHYILTPDIMERLAAFQKSMRFDFTLTFIGTSMHAYINRGALFEGDLNADRTNFAAYRSYYEQLRQVFELVEAMNLNTRLWTKA